MDSRSMEMNSWRSHKYEPDRRDNRDRYDDKSRRIGDRVEGEDKDRLGRNKFDDNCKVYDRFDRERDRYDVHINLDDRDRYEDRERRDRDKHDDRGITRRDDRDRRNDDRDRRDDRREERSSWRSYGEDTNHRGTPLSRGDWRFGTKEVRSREDVTLNREYEDRRTVGSDRREERRDDKDMERRNGRESSRDERGSTKDDRKEILPRSEKCK